MNSIRAQTEEPLVTYMLDLQKQAESTGGTTTDPASSQTVSTSVIEDALYYGLDALKQKRILLKNVIQRVEA